MKNQNGITLLSLITSIVILIIIASITIYNSAESYKLMKYETFKAQLEEMQAAVDKICEKYKTKGYTSYNDTTTGFFKSEYDSIPSSLDEASQIEYVDEIIDKYFNGNSMERAGYVFYFNQDEIQKYFNLNGIEYDMIVDFSTRYVFAVGGCKNPENDDFYYSILDYNPDFVIKTDVNKTTSDLTGITINKSLEIKTGDTKMYKITLKLHHGESDKTDYNIKKAYYSTDGGTSWIEVDYLDECKYTDNSVSFFVYKSGTYLFKIEDTSGAVITTVQGTGGEAEETINL